MSTTTIWHNPRCSKSRLALALLTDRGIEPEIIEYLKTPPSRSEIKKALELLGVDADALMRKGESIYKELDLARIKDRDVLIEAMAAHPVLIERPIVFHDGKAAVGRPLENVLKLFQG
jgi:arsenate reductase